ncbi:AAA family ATPase, partial [Asticcacaulis sp.]|uniref:AAA family ATPase n=1 Tax=Asticcacaulis sp. TaxID=1872648 RepID=UPI002601FB86
VGVSGWVPLRLSFSPSGGFEYKALSDDIDLHRLTSDFLSTISYGVSANRKFMPLGDSLLLPTVLYFTADRRIAAPKDRRGFLEQPAISYSPAHKFDGEGDTWASSLDGLLVWYEWLGGGLFEEAARLVNELLFAGTNKRLVKVDRHDLAAVIEVEREDGTKHRHGIGQLSHGERSLIHLLVRSAYHKAGSTILMIDEMENHLHPQWQYRLMNILKDWIRLWPDLTVIASTHSPALLEAFAFERQEEGLVKGGYLIEANDL